MELNSKGCENLAVAIYKRAAKDYIEAVVTGNKYKMKSIKRFLVSGAYDTKPEAGKYIIEHCEKEANVAEKFIDSFLESDAKNIAVDAKTISIPVLRTIVSMPYFKKTLSLRYKLDSYYLTKK